MGSTSDGHIGEEVQEVLDEFGVKAEIRVISAHRAPDTLKEYIESSDSKVFIGIAGKAAHLSGVIASHTIRPVIGIPAKSSTMDGLDSLLSTVQMPSGVPVATVAINGGKNAGLLAIQMLALEDEELAKKLVDYKKKMAEDSVR